MKYTIRQKLVIFSLVILACSIFIGSAIYEGNQKVVDTEQWVQHTEQVIGQSESILSQAKDIETNSRGFVITNDSAYLAPLFIAEKTIFTSVARLRQLTLDNPTQLRRIDSLDLYIHRRLDFSQQMIQLRSKEGLAAAASFTATNHGWNDGEHIHKITDAIQTEESGLLEQRKLDNERSASTFNRFSVILFIALMVFTILLLVGTGNYWVQEKRGLEIQQLNSELEQTVIDRTANMDKYKYFFYNTLDMACFANLDGYFEELNGSFTKALGYTVQDLLDKKFYEFIHPDDIDATLKVVEKLSSGANAVNFTNRYRTKSNTYQQLEWNALFNSKTQKICAIARNVTERMIAHNEVVFQNNEKEKRAAELVVANKELAFQNKEKENRAMELIVANRELAFQNQEKENRAAESTIANKELAFQNTEKENRASELVVANSELAFQNKEKENRAMELIVANKELAFQNQEKENRAAELTIANKELAFQNTEKENRAAELVVANEELAFQNKEKGNRAMELIVANKELAFQNQEKENRASELTIANKELAFQNTEKENRASELVVANSELAFQNKEKENRAMELIVANKELAFQNQEKENRAAELVIANKELAFQNDEKENRAAELTIANKELAFQNTEKENRAAELAIANKELAFQNDEKENRASELAVANKELAFQNTEKENRAAELAIANKELAFQNDEKENRASELAVANKELAFQNKEKEKRAAELTMANNELKKAEDDVHKLNEELEQKVVKRTVELELVNKELESFSYSVSHDLRAPLRAIHGYAQMLKEDYGIQLDAEANRIMNNVMNSAKKMGRLIDDLLAFSRLGRKELVKVNIPMCDMVKNICREIKDENGGRNVQFNVDELEPARGDAVAIKQAWVNLISNAVKYSKLKDKAVIEIGSGTKGGDIVYYVKDNGAGFDMRYANKLFGVFQRLHTEDKFEGTGVGLAIVHRIISKHGGKIWAEAKVNEGATFYFSLPKNK